MTYTIRETLRWASLMLCLWFSGGIMAQPTGFTDELYFDGWNQAVGITFDQDGVLYVWEKRGQVHIVQDSVRRAAPLLNIQEEVGNFGDHGFLGFALDPNYYSTGYIYCMYVVDRHHLLYYGTPSYNPNATENGSATIGRIVRYTVTDPQDPAIATVDYNSRVVLVGETASTGFPIVHSSHGIGTLVFGTDGTLLAACGDGASYQAVDAGGSVGNSYAVQALADGIINTQMDVGAYRSQMLESLNGKIIRIDPATGDGIASNPFYEPANPRSNPSRVWALGLRNPSRMTLKPNTGSHYESDGDPGVIYIGDVGWNGKEELDVCDGPAQNFGWPAYEGMDQRNDYFNASPYHQYAPTSGGCTQPYYKFTDLIKQYSGGAQPIFSDPCSPGNEIDSTVYDLFAHRKPAVDWRNGTVYASIDGVTSTVGAGPVPGPSFNGNCSIGGAFYTGTSYPSQYQGRYFHADYGKKWIRGFDFNSDNQPDSIMDFAANLDPIVYLESHPISGDIYYIAYSTKVRRFTYSPTGNQKPVAVAAADTIYAPSASLTVNFDGTSSSDPEGAALTYSWNFGDGNSDTGPTPSHTFNAAGAIPETFTVTLTVTDTGGLAAITTLDIYLNNTPPSIVWTSLDTATDYTLLAPKLVPLEATIIDLEHLNANLTWEWQSVLYHNDHNHPDPVIYDSSSTVSLDPIGCESDTYWWRVNFTITDPEGLSSSTYKDLYPRCDIPYGEEDHGEYIVGMSRTLDVLSNDIILDGYDPATLTIIQSPNAGIATPNLTDGTIHYQHNGIASNGDTLSYTIADSTGGDVSQETFVYLSELPAPALSITDPVEGAVLTLTDISVSYSLTGNTDSVHHVLIELDGDSISEFIFDGSAQFLTVPVGSHVLIATLFGDDGQPLSVDAFTDTMEFDTESILGSFTFARTITIHASEVSGSADLMDFPVLIKDTIPELRHTSYGGNVSSMAGFDIAFVDSVGGSLSFQTERYDPTIGEWIGWVRIPVLSYIQDTEIRILFGNASATGSLASATTWNSCYQGRWHMDGDAGLAGPQLGDGTANGFDGTANGGMTNADRIEGPIGYASYFDGSDDYYEISGNLIPGGVFTLSAWIRSEQADDSWHGFMGNSSGGTNQRAPSLWMRQYNRIHGGFGDGSGWRSWITPDSVMTDGEGIWHYVVSTFDGTNYTLYIDGLQVYNSTGQAGYIPTATNFRYIGRVDNYFQGGIDEVSVCSSPHDADWILTEYRNQASPETFYTLGTVATLPVEWISVTAEQVGQQGQIRWTTASEVHNERFEVEKSFDAVDFQIISTMEADRNPGTYHHYEVTDPALDFGTQYYRIKQIDIDGAFSYSPMVEITRAAPQALFSIGPNPATNTLHISMQETIHPTGIERIRLLNSQGQTVLHQHLAGTPRQSVSLPVDQLASGIYLLLIESDHQTHQQSIQIVH
ncbi:DUF2341 domain-containing protein [Pontibacter sp. G13]|uniref:DUF2341 domain-containing protein n=1 Tax=Pontibacter sp. G13 TaxID=3074898 RepID=UPI00288B9251|nr:DUF2341 domain-containing protein [Pontibacter sp. G13]WNJ16722.1 DUF2341 domain-containing protein [Pontibacter sp. G13]